MVDFICLKAFEFLSVLLRFYGIYYNFWLLSISFPIFNDKKLIFCCFTMGLSNEFFEFIEEFGAFSNGDSSTSVQITSVTPFFNFKFD